MLGDQLGEEHGQITGMRVLASEGAPKVEVSFQATGTLAGVEVSDMGTYVSVARPDGTAAASISLVTLGSKGFTMIMRGSASLKRRYAGVCATATMAMSVLLDALIGRSPRVFLERFEVDVGLAGGRPAIDDLLPGARLDVVVQHDHAVRMRFAPDHHHLAPPLVVGVDDRPRLGGMSAARTDKT